MMFRGNKKLGNNFDLSRKFETIGGQINASTSHFFTEYWLDYHIDFYQEGIQHFCSFLKYPCFDSIDVERSIILEEILEDYGYENQLINTDTITTGLIWKDQPLGRPVIGNKSSLFTLDEKDLENWYKKFYQNENITLGISGDINIEETIELISEEFKSPKTKAPIAKSPSSLAEPVHERFSSVYHKDSQFCIQWSFLLEKMDPLIRLLFGLILRILNDGTGSRLQRKIREEKGLVYDIDTDCLLESGSGLLSITSTVSKAQLPELVKTLVLLIDKLTTEGITEDELQLAKLKFRVGLDYCNDTPTGVLAETIGEKLIPHYLSQSETLEKLSTITTTQINTLIQQLFRKNESYFVCVGPGSSPLDKEMRTLLKNWI